MLVVLGRDDPPGADAQVTELPTPAAPGAPPTGSGEAPGQAGGTTPAARVDPLLTIAADAQPTR